MMISFENLREIVPNLPHDYVEQFYQKFRNNDSAIYQLHDLQEKYISTNDNYKIFECIDKNCELASCPFYHGLQDRRRDPVIYNYDSKLCHVYNRGGIWDYKSKCTNGDFCRFCHSYTEMQYHPSNRFPRQPQPELPIIKGRDTSTVVQKVQQIILIRETITNIEKENHKKEKELAKIDEEVTGLRKISLCFCCKETAYKYFVPCGHLLCENCKEKSRGSCFLCQKNFDQTKVMKLTK